MNSFPKRLVVFPKDLKNITGLKRWAVYKLVGKIRAYKNKSADELLTVDDVSEYLGIPATKITEFLN